MNPLEHARSAFRPVLEAVAPDAGKVGDYLGMVKPAANADHGDYQANFAMPLAKALGRKPPEVAADIVARFADPAFETPTVAGPGFINLRYKSAWLAERLREAAADERLGVGKAASPRRFVVDYSGPNVAKPLHVGHIRSTIIGESLCRVLRFLGHDVVGDNHLGDWGTQFGMLLYGYKHHLDAAAYKADPVRELARLYVLVRQLAKANDDDEAETPNPIAEEYRNETAKLHRGDPENVALWKEFMPACMAEVEAIYRRLDVHFDHMYGESHYHPMLAGVVDDLLAKGIAGRATGPRSSNRSRTASPWCGSGTGRSPTRRPTSRRSKNASNLSVLGA